MKSLALRAVALALISCLILVWAPQAAAQANTTPEPVKVVNTAKNPVPTVAQGTTKISGNVNVTNNPLPVNGNVNVTNNPLPVSGNVNVTNSSLPVNGTVDVSNLPLDTNGNVLVSVAPDTTQYQFQSIVAFQGGGGCANNYGIDYCTFNGSQNVPIEQTLTSLASQGYELFSVAPIPSGAAGIASTYMLYTLRAPVTGVHKKARPARR